MEGIPDDYNLIRLNGRTYTIAETAVPSLDAAVEAIRGIHARRVDAVTQQLQQDFVAEAFRLEADEANRIVRLAQQNAVSVPNERRCLPLVVLDNTLCPVRSMLYAPDVFRGTMAGWTHWTAQDDPLWAMMNEKLGYDVWEESRTNRTGHTLSIAGTPELGCTAVTLYTLLRGAMFCSRNGFHTTGRHFDNAGVAWYSMCTGNTPGEAYWNLPLAEFKAAVNSINLDSMAGNIVPVTAGALNTSQLCRRLINPVVTHIRPDDPTWGGTR